MSLLNLTMAEFAALLGLSSALVVALYLLSRARRRQKVATLRFWTAAARPDSSHQRRRIQQPVSLLLQLLALALLLLAIAQPRFGGGESKARDHVLVLDTSSWMAAGQRDRTLMDEAKESARQWLDRIPSSDRAMLVRADGLPLPATPMTADREALRKAIAESRPSAAALDLTQALLFASEARGMNARQPGEVVFVGAGRVQEQESPLPPVERLRIIRVGQPFEDCGLRGIGMRRSAANPGEWEVFLSVRNYGARAASVPLVVQFAGSQVASRRLELLPGREQEFAFNLRTRAAGWLEARLLVHDALGDDDRAIIEVPAQPPLRIAVFTDEPDLLRALFSSNPYVQATLQRQSAYNPDASADVFLLDGFSPRQMPAAATLWLRPPGPTRQKVLAAGPAAVRWKVDHEISTGLRANTVQLEAASVIDPQPGDVVIADVPAGPVVLARTRPQRMVLFGYHPGLSESRFDVATPLLFANALRWLKPEAFRSIEVHAGTVGALTVPLDADEDAGGFTVRGENGEVLPYSVHGRSLRFFAGTPGTVRVSGPHGERVYSLTLPGIGETTWAAPAQAAIGLPPRSFSDAVRELWPWLSLAALLVMTLEWFLYGRGRNPLRKIVELPLRPFARKAS